MKIPPEDSQEHCVSAVSEADTPVTAPGGISTQEPGQGIGAGLNALPLSSLIGGPLRAAVEAQAESTRKSRDFLQQVGMEGLCEAGKSRSHEVGKYEVDKESNRTK